MGYPGDYKHLQTKSRCSLPQTQENTHNIVAGLDSNARLIAGKEFVYIFSTINADVATPARSWTRMNLDESSRFVAEALPVYPGIQN